MCGAPACEGLREQSRGRQACSASLRRSAGTPTAFRCSVSWPVAELASFAALTTLKQAATSQSTKRAARAGHEPCAPPRRRGAAPTRRPRLCWQSGLTVHVKDWWSPLAKSMRRNSASPRLVGCHSLHVGAYAYDTAPMRDCRRIVHGLPAGAIRLRCSRSVRSESAALRFGRCKGQAHRSNICQRQPRRWLHTTVARSTPWTAKKFLPRLTSWLVDPVSLPSTG